MPPGALVMTAGIERTATASVGLFFALNRMLQPVMSVSGLIVKVKMQLSPLYACIGLRTAIYPSLAVNENAVSTLAVSACCVAPAVNACAEPDALNAYVPTATGSVKTD